MAGRTFRIGVFGICIVLAYWADSEPLQGANPSISKPAEAIPLHEFMPEAKKIHEAAIADDSQCWSLYNEMKKSGAKAASLGKLAMHSKRLRRMSERLLSLGESSGAEFYARYELHRVHFEEAFAAFQGMPQSAPMRQKVVTALQRDTPNRKKVVASVTKKLAEDPFAAEASFDTAYDKYESIAGILNAGERGPFSEFLELDTRVTEALKIARVSIVNEAVQKRSQSIASEMDAFMVALPVAITAIKKGTTTWREKSVSGPELLDSICQEFCILQAKLQRAHASQYLIASASTGYGSGGPPAGLSSEFSNRLQAIREELPKIATAIMENDLRDDPQPLVRLTQHIEVLGKVAHRVGNDVWIDALDNSVAAVSKKFGLATKVDAYRSATNDLLAWKERFAATQEQILTSQSKTLSTVIGDATRRSAEQSGYIFVGPSAGGGAPQFHSSTYEALPNLGKRLGPNAVAYVKNVVRMDGNSSAWVSSWDNYIYASLPKDWLPKNPSMLLRESLNTSDIYKPLSVRAASAIYTSERGDGLTVGGTIGEVFVEGASARIISLPDVAAPFVGLDKQPTYPREAHQRIASLRASLTPNWARHRYFALTNIP